MPKQPGGIPKVERLEALKEVLKRWGRLNKTLIDQHVAAFLSCDSEDISRALYRDLEELVSRGQIRAIHFSRDGVEISDFDPEIHKNTFCEWVPTDQNPDVLGGSLLNPLGVELLIPESLQRALSISQTKSPTPPPPGIHVYSFFESESFIVRIDPQELPITCVIARAPRETNPLESQKVIASITKAFGRRTGMIFFKSKTISSFKDHSKEAGKEEVQLGHFCLEFLADGSLAISDLGSKNGTQARPLTRKSAHQILMNETQGGGFTVSSEQWKAEEDPSLWTRLVPNQKSTFPLPTMIRIEPFFKMIIVNKAE